MSKVLVTLDYEELEYCAYAGARIRVNAIERKQQSPTKDLDYKQQNYWQSHIVGVIGEYAVAKALGEQWVERSYDKHEFDVLQYQIRTSEQAEPMLRMRAHNNPEHIYILAQSKANRVLIHGWAVGYDIKQYGILEYPNCWSLPANQLNDMNALIHPIIYTNQVRQWKAPDYQ